MTRSNATKVSILTLGLLAVLSLSANAEIKTGRPEFDKAAKACAAFLRGSIGGNGLGSGKTSIGSYALIKAGDNPLTSAPIKATINAVLKKFQGTKGYRAQQIESERDLRSGCGCYAA